MTVGAPRSRAGLGKAADCNRAMSTSDSTTGYRVAKACTVAELDDAARVRWQVFSDAMQLAPGLLPALREINGFDVLDTTDNFVCYRGEEAIGTIRLLRPNPAVARVQKLPLGLPLELQCRIDDMPPRAHVAELGRAAILREHRGSPAIGRLYRAAYEASRRDGITHWIGFSLTETDLRADTNIVLAILGEKGRTASRPCLRSTLPEPDHVPCRPFYTEEQRRLAAEGSFDTLPLPAIVRFLLGLGLSFVGPPIFEPTFKEYGLPIILPLDDFARSIFGRRCIGRAAPAEPDRNAAA
ncbi:hypothetical protein EKPJFOCH_0045 [Methylobacterium thuringiense]|uniref:GNAT family N-acetyltransferase n=2 Tax=Methylobacterium thuringiense TaxID=1003091 RepID=A0ABQ4THT2_9HYPH|nr:hypothetical protein EKPJFOCH_0045 [Methylobacterium thuringiense]